MVAVALLEFIAYLTLFSLIWIFFSLPSIFFLKLQNPWLPVGYIYFPTISIWFSNLRHLFPDRLRGAPLRDVAKAIVVGMS